MIIQQYESDFSFRLQDYVFQHLAIFYVFIPPFLDVFQCIFEALFSRHDQITKFFWTFRLKKLF